MNVKCECICNIGEFCKMAVPWNLYILFRIQVGCCSATKTQDLCFHCGLQEEGREKPNCSSFMNSWEKLPFGNVTLTLNASFKGLKNRLF